MCNLIGVIKQTATARESENNQDMPKLFSEIISKTNEQIFAIIHSLPDTIQDESEMKAKIHGLSKEYQDSCEEFSKAYDKVQDLQSKLTGLQNKMSVEMLKQKNVKIKFGNLEQ